MGKKPVILFLCTGNSCRSQMAEGFAKALGKDQVEVYSAGIEPAGVHPHAVTVMFEQGVDISQQTSDPINSELLHQADLLITLCGDSRDRCPAIPSHIRREHWPLPDPAGAGGDEEEIMDNFRSVRDEIKRRVMELLDTLL